MTLPPLQSRHGLFSLLRGEQHYRSAWCSLSSHENNFQTFDSVLSEQELFYYKKLKATRRITSFLGGRLAARLAIGLLVGESDMSKIIIKRGVFDYPVVSYPFSDNIQVSISHDDNIIFALAFFEDHPLAIDVENISEKKIGALLQASTQMEIVKMGESSWSHVEILTALWTAKEALAKIIRTGMMLDFKLCEINAVDALTGWLKIEFKNFPQYKSLTTIRNGQAISIVLPRLTEINENQLSLIYDSFSVFDLER